MRGDIGYNDFWLTWAGMEKPQQYILIPKKGYAADDAARQIFRDFLKTDATHLLLLDDDATFAPQTLNRLMSRNLPVVSALVFTKSMPPMPTIWRGASGIENKFITWRTRVDDVIKFFEMDGVGSQIRQAFSDNNTQSALVLADSPHALSRTDNVGFHCTLIRRDVVETIGEPFCEGTEHGVHEDFDFSSRAIQAGFDLYVDKTVISGHISTRATGAMDFWAWMMLLQLDAQQMADLEAKADKAVPNAKP
jgi:GT2 family glycosyltransferase